MKKLTPYVVDLLNGDAAAGLVMADYLDEIHGNDKQLQGYLVRLRKGEQGAPFLTDLLRKYGSKEERKHMQKWMSLQRRQIRRKKVKRRLVRLLMKNVLDQLEKGIVA